MQSPGRWHTAGQEVIYASEYYSTALLEVRAYNSSQPVNQRYVEITFQPDVSCEVLDPATLRDWDAPQSRTAQVFGSLWIAEVRSAILVVPSVIARIDRNILLNPRHADADRAWNVGEELPVTWDDRLF